MVAISVKHDLDKLQRTLKYWEKKQVPFAASQALNDLAFLIRNDTVKVLWPRSVQVKQKNFARAAFRVQKANKRRLTSAVYDSLNRQVFRRQIDGGIRLPYSSTHLAIPTRNALTASGRIKKVAQLGSPKLFKMALRKRNEPGLWIRNSKGLKLMYTLELRANVKKAFPFFEFGKRTAAIHWSWFMDRRLKVALKTAR